VAFFEGPTLGLFVFAFRARFSAKSLQERKNYDVTSAKSTEKWKEG
jgi:hypothetical protein